MGKDGSRHVAVAATKISLRLHRGDIMSPEKRSQLMARIKGRHTGPERAIASALRTQGLYPSRHVRRLPGTPDFVFHRLQIAVFVDGNFWHGWQFDKWRLKLSERWEAKIAANIRRDKAAHRALRRQGWKVIRIWEHQVEKDIDGCVRRILEARSSARRAGPGQTRKGLV